MGGELKQGSDPHIRAIVWVRGETFRAGSERADLWQPRWNEIQAIFAAATHSPDRDAGPLEGAVAGSWSLGIVEQSQGRGCCWLRKDGSAQGDVREEIVVGKACGGKPGSHGSKAILPSHARRWGHHHSLSLPTRQHWQLNNREDGPSNAWRTELHSRAPPRVPPFKHLTCRSTE